MTAKYKWESTNWESTNKDLHELKMPLLKIDVYRYTHDVFTWNCGYHYGGVVVRIKLSSTTIQEAKIEAINNIRLQLNQVLNNLDKVESV